jgi:multimeric flavodoxin WrbA
MMKTALLINASPKPGRSTSLAMCEYLGERLKERGMEVKESHLRKERNEVIEEMDTADLVVLASPVYVDSLPSELIALMEDFSATKEAKKREQTMIAIVNCGFPEPAHCATAITITSIFAKRMGFAWGGGLPMGMGEMTMGRTLEEAGGAMRRPRKALDLTAATLAEGHEVPIEAVRLMAKAPIPKWMFVKLAHRRWRQEAAGNGCSDKMGDTPFS